MTSSAAADHPLLVSTAYSESDDFNLRLALQVVSDTVTRTRDKNWLLYVSLSLPLRCGALKYVHKPTAGLCFDAGSMVEWSSAV